MTRLSRVRLTLALLIAAALLISCNTEAKKQQIRLGEASRNLGEAYMASNNYTAALRELLKAESMNPDDPYLQNDLGLVYLNKNRYDKAVAHFQKALAIDPGYAPARNNLGTAYLAREDWDLAIATFQEVAEDLLYATPHFPMANMGWAYYKKGEFEKAVEAYQSALDLQPTFIVALRGLGKTYMAMGRVKDAIEPLDKAIEVAPKVADLHFEIGMAYLRLQRTDKALDAFRKAKALAADNDLAEAADQEILMILNKQ